MSERTPDSGSLDARIARLARDIAPPSETWAAVEAALHDDVAHVDALARRLPADVSPPPGLWTAIRHAIDSGPAPAAPVARARGPVWALAALGVAATLVVGIFIGRLTIGIDRPDDRGSLAIIAAAGDIAASVPEPYRLAAEEHFAAAETLLVLFGADSGVDADLAGKARELAARSRALIVSRAGDDAQIRAVLLDLELLLTQIAQLADDGDPMENELVLNGVEDTDMLNRLRRLESRDEAPI